MVDTRRTAKTSANSQVNQTLKTGKKQALPTQNGGKVQRKDRRQNKTRKPGKKAKKVTAKSKKVSKTKKPEKETNEAEDQSQIKNTEKPTKQRKQKRYRPGTLALREISRDTPAVTLSEKLDKSYYRFIKKEKLTHKLRSENKVYHNIARKLKVMGENHPIREEADQFWEFINGVDKTNIDTVPISSGVFCYESNASRWIPQIVRFTGGSPKRRTACNSDGDEKVFWDRHCTTPKAIGPIIRKARGDKPVAFMVGSKNRDGDGHCVLVAIVKQANEEYVAWVKDPNPVIEVIKNEDGENITKEITMKTMVLKVLQEVNDVKTAYLVGMLDTEKHVVYTECLKESYKILGDILDNHFFWNRKVVGFAQVWDVKKGKKLGPYQGEDN